MKSMAGGALSAEPRRPLIHVARVSILIICAAVLTTTPALAGDFAQSFQEAASLGDAQERAPSTKDYFTNTLLPYYGQKYASVLQSCFASVPKPDASRFSFVVAIGTNGRMLRLYRVHETNIFACMRATLENDSFPPPPVSPYYLHIDMQFTDEPESSPQASSSRKTPPLVLEPNKYSYTFGVPQGWDFSFEEAQEHGARLVFFPKGGGFDQSNSIIYVTELCGAHCAGTGAFAIDRAIKEARDDSPALEVSEEKPLAIKDSGDAPVRVLTGARDPRQAKEALAFIEHDEAIILVVLTTKDTKTWRKDYDTLREIVTGHRFFTCNAPDLAKPCR